MSHTIICAELKHSLMELVCVTLHHVTGVIEYQFIRVGQLGTQQLAHYNQTCSLKPELD